jgi:tetratricopeptide (TPR) repeat protein
MWWSRSHADYRLAQVRDLMGKKEKARADFKQMETIFAPLVDSHRDVPEYRRYLALCRCAHASSLKYSGYYKEGDKLYRAALALQKQLVDEYPTVPEYSKELADTHEALAWDQPSGSTRLAPDWENEFRQALSLRQKLVNEFPRVTKYAVELCKAQIRFGAALEGASRYADAERELRQSLKELERFPKQLRNTVELRESEELAHTNLDIIYAKRGCYDEAVKEAKAALDIAAALKNKFPSVPRYRQELAWMHVNLSRRYLALRRWKEEEQELLLALKLLEHLKDEFPKESGYAADAAYRQLELAHVCLRLRSSAKALDWCDGAEKTFRSEHDRNPSFDIQAELDYLRPRRARALAQLKRYPEALAEVQRCGTKPEDALHVACAYSLLSAAALQNDKWTPPERARISEDHALRAIELLAGLDRKNDWLLGLLKTYEDLNPLRARSDFIALVKRAEEDSAKQAGK